jgi:multidrug efflux system outer membrane protein
MNKTSVIALACASMLSACSLIPTYERPAAPVDAKWPDSAITKSSEKASESPLWNKDWKDFYTDETLQELIRIALANNRDMRVAVLNIEQTRAQVGLTRAAQFPTVNATVTGSRTPSSDGGITSAYTGGLVFTSYELDFFGRVASLKEQALAQFLASAESSKTVRITLMSSVAQGWLTLLADEELLRISRQTLASREETFKLTELKRSHGAASDLDWRLAQTVLESARVTLAQQLQTRAKDENALVLLLGQSLPASARSVLAKGQLEGQQFADLPPGLPSDMLTYRPDIRQAEQTLLASNANIGAARAAFFPRISLTAGAGSASGELSGLFKNGSWGWTMAPSLVLPIFDAGSNQASLDSARVARDIAVAQYEKAIQTAFSEVSNGLAGQDTLAQQLRSSEGLLKAESERSRLIKLEFDNGAASQLDWLDAQRSLFTVQQSLVQTRLSYLQNQITLFKSLGGGAEGATAATPGNQAPKN